MSEVPNTISNLEEQHSMPNGDSDTSLTEGSIISHSEAFSDSDIEHGVRSLTLSDRFSSSSPELSASAAQSDVEHHWISGDASQTDSEHDSSSCEIPPADSLAHSVEIEHEDKVPTVTSESVVESPPAESSSENSNELAETSDEAVLKNPFEDASLLESSSSQEASVTSPFEDVSAELSSSMVLLDLSSTTTAPSEEVSTDISTEAASTEVSTEIPTEIPTEAAPTEAAPTEVSSSESAPSVAPAETLPVAFSVDVESLSKCSQPCEMVTVPEGGSEVLARRAAEAIDKIVQAFSSQSGVDPKQFAELCRNHLASSTDPLSSVSVNIPQVLSVPETPVAPKALPKSFERMPEHENDNFVYLAGLIGKRYRSLRKSSFSEDVEFLRQFVKNADGTANVKMYRRFSCPVSRGRKESLRKYVRRMSNSASFVRKEVRADYVSVVLPVAIVFGLRKYHQWIAADHRQFLVTAPEFSDCDSIEMWFNGNTMRTRAAVRCMRGWR